MKREKKINKGGSLPLNKVKLIFLSLLILCCVAFTPQYTNEATTELSDILKQIKHWSNFWTDYYKIDGMEDILTGRIISSTKIEDLTICLIQHESRFEPRSKSWEKTTKCYSWGLMRLLPNTARGLGWGGQDPEELLDTNLNIKLGIKYLCWQIKRYQCIKRGVAAYNAGHTKYTSDSRTRYINQWYVNKVYHHGYIAYRIHYRGQL